MRVLEQEELDGRDVFALKRRGVNGNESRRLAGKQIHIRLRDIAAKRLSDENGMLDSLLLEQAVKHARKVIEAPGKRKGPRQPVRGAIPDKTAHARFARKVLHLPIEQAMIGRQPRQEDEGPSRRIRAPARPVVDDAVFGLVSLMLRGIGHVCLRIPT